MAFDPTLYDNANDEALGRHLYNINQYKDFESGKLGTVVSYSGTQVAFADAVTAIKNAIATSRAAFDITVILSSGIHQNLVGNSHDWYVIVSQG